MKTLNISLETWKKLSALRTKMQTKEFSNVTFNDVLIELLGGVNKTK